MGVEVDVGGAGLGMSRLESGGSGSIFLGNGDVMDWTEDGFGWFSCLDAAFLFLNIRYSAFG